MLPAEVGARVAITWLRDTRHVVQGGDHGGGWRQRGLHDLPGTQTVCREPEQHPGTGELYCTVLYCTGELSVQVLVARC